jgi:hypothetical protein
VLDKVQEAQGEKAPGGKTAGEINNAHRAAGQNPCRLFLMEVISLETWKDIPGYEGKYQASDMGRIRSLDQKVRGVCHFTGKEFYRM